MFSPQLPVNYLGYAEGASGAGYRNSRGHEADQPGSYNYGYEFFTGRYEDVYGYGMLDQGCAQFWKLCAKFIMD